MGPRINLNLLHQDNDSSKSSDIIQSNSFKLLAACMLEGNCFRKLQPLTYGLFTYISEFNFSSLNLIFVLLLKSKPLSLVS